MGSNSLTVGVNRSRGPENLRSRSYARGYSPMLKHDMSSGLHTKRDSTAADL